MALIEQKTVTDRILTAFNNLVTGILISLNSDGTLKRKFGAWESKNVNTIYQADTDGIVHAHTSITGANQPVTLYGATEINTPPVTVRIRDSNIYPAGGPTAMVGITMAVKKGNYWRVTRTTTGVVVEEAVYWLPLGV